MRSKRQNMRPADTSCATSSRPWARGPKPA
jgi:hypothetical protein